MWTVRWDGAERVVQFLDTYAGVKAWCDAHTDAHGYGDWCFDAEWSRPVGLGLLQLCAGRDVAVIDGAATDTVWDALRAAAPRLRWTG